MYIAMNRFRIAPGHEQDFVTMWKNRDTYLASVPGFKKFHLLQGPANDNETLFASYSVWESQAAFEAWTRSDAFRKAHAGAGGTRDMYLGPPQLEGFQVVL